MTDKPKWRRDDALAVGNRIVALLQPFCEQILICGSIRRYKAFVGDIEILYRPKLAPGIKLDLIEEPLSVDACAQEIEKLHNSGFFGKRASKTGVFTWGKLNKLAVHLPTMIPVDLFCEPDAKDWWRSVVIRTGSAECNIRLIESAARRGLKMHAYGRSFTRMSDNEVIPCDSEQKVFELCGVPWLEPKERTK